MKRSSSFIIILLFIISMNCACSQKNQYLGFKKESISFDEQIFSFEQPPKIEIIGDTSNIEIFNWDGKDVKFEIFKKVKRTYNSEKELKADYDKFNLTTEHTKDKISFDFKYKASKSETKNPLDQAMDLKIYIPKKIKSLTIKLDLGKIIVHDDLNCNVFAELKAVSMEIKKLQGVLDFKGDIGNIKLSNGKIYDGSNIKVNTGNIDLKFDYETGGHFEFATKIGNIDLSMPSSSQINLDSSGYLQKNELVIGEYPTKIKTITDVGRICINKY